MRIRRSFIVAFVLTGILSLSLSREASIVLAQSGYPATVPIDITTGTTTLLVTATGTNSVYVQNFGLTVQNAVGTDTTIKFVAGTGSLCAGSQVNVTGAIGVYSGATSGGIASIQAPTPPSSSYVLKGGGGLNLCAITVSNNHIAGYLNVFQGPS